MTTQTNSQRNAISAINLAGLVAALAWGLFVIVGPLSVALLVHVPAGHYGMAVGCVVVAGSLGAPWCLFGLPTVRRFVSSFLD